MTRYPRLFDPVVEAYEGTYEFLYRAKVDMSRPDPWAIRLELGSRKEPFSDYPILKSTLDKRRSEGDNRANPLFGLWHGQALLNMAGYDIGHGSLLRGYELLIEATNRYDEMLRDPYENSDVFTNDRVRVALAAAQYNMAVIAWQADRGFDERGREVWHVGNPYVGAYEVVPERATALVAETLASVHPTGRDAKWRLLDEAVTMMQTPRDLPVPPEPYFRP